MFASLYAKGPVAYKSIGSTSDLEFDSPWERISQNLTALVLSVVGDVPVDSEAPVVDSEAPVVTSSILRICRYRAGWPVFFVF
jgi:hypothetical protein